MNKLLLTAVLLSSLLIPATARIGKMNYCWFDQWLAWALGHQGILYCNGDEY